MWLAITPLIPSKYFGLIQFLRHPKDMTKICAANDLPIMYGGVIVPNWTQWLEGTHKSLREAGDINIRKFCRRGQGENVPASELEEYAKEASTEAEWFPLNNTLPTKALV
eukprot:CFRG1425T1